MYEDTLKIEDNQERTVLVVDSDSRSRIETARALEAAGFLTLTAPDSETAMDLAALSHIEAVILDPPSLAESATEREPRAADFTTLEALRACPDLCQLPIFIVSSDNAPGQRVEGLKRGADDYLTKPFDLEELILRLERRLSHSKPNNSNFVSTLHRAVANDTLESPINIGRYEAQRVIGRGAMGVVLAGIDPHLNRPVAIKVLTRAAVQLSGSEPDDFRREGTALARFDHENIVKIYDAGFAEGLPYLVMELVEGISLSTQLEQGRLEPRRAVSIATAVAKALATAHDEGWVHRDIKPANILLGDDGTIKVTDFGLASLAAESNPSERIFGTPGYAPPECLLGEPHTVRGDLFALGSLFYYCLTGIPAFSGNTLSERLSATIAGRFEPLHEAMPEVARPLCKLVHQLLAPLPGERPESARMVARRLEWIAEALNIPALPLDDLEPVETIPVLVN